MCDEVCPTDSEIHCSVPSLPSEHQTHYGRKGRGPTVPWASTDYIAPVAKPSADKFGKIAGMAALPPQAQVIGEPGPIARTDDPDNSHVAAQQIEPTRGTKRAQVLDALRAARGEWVDAPTLATQEVGGFGGTRRMRELRDMGWPIETRQKPGAANVWQHRLPS